MPTVGRNGVRCHRSLNRPCVAQAISDAGELRRAERLSAQEKIASNEQRDADLFLNAEADVQVDQEEEEESEEESEEEEEDQATRCYACERLVRPLAATTCKFCRVATYCSKTCCSNHTQHVHFCRSQPVERDDAYSCALRHYAAATNAARRNSSNEAFLSAELAIASLCRLLPPRAFIDTSAFNIPAKIREIYFESLKIATTHALKSGKIPHSHGTSM